MSSPVAEDLNGTQAAVLAYLTSGPRSGWDVATGLRELVGEFWNVTQSQVYRELRAMTDAGLVKPGEAGARDRRPYAITKRGRKALSDWATAPAPADTVRIPILLKMFLLFRLHEADEHALAELVDAYRADHEQRLANYQAIVERREAGGLPDSHIASYGVFHEKAVLAWLDSLPWRATT